MKTSNLFRYFNISATEISTMLNLAVDLSTQESQTLNIQKKG